MSRWRVWYEVKIDAWVAGRPMDTTLISADNLSKLMEVMGGTRGISGYCPRSVLKDLESDPINQAYRKRRAAA